MWGCTETLTSIFCPRHSLLSPKRQFELLYFTYKREVMGLQYMLDGKDIL
jgi:hypothetical protein